MLPNLFSVVSKIIAHLLSKVKVDFEYLCNTKYLENRLLLSHFGFVDFLNLKSLPMCEGGSLLAKGLERMCTCTSVLLKRPSSV